MTKHHHHHPMYRIRKMMMTTTSSMKFDVGGTSTRDTLWCSVETRLGTGTFVILRTSPSCVQFPSTRFVACARVASSHLCGHTSESMTRESRALVFQPQSTCTWITHQRRNGLRRTVGRRQGRRFAHWRDSQVKNVLSCTRKHSASRRPTKRPFVAPPRPVTRHVTICSSQHGTPNRLVRVHQFPTRMDMSGPGPHSLTC